MPHAPLWITAFLVCAMHTEARAQDPMARAAETAGRPAAGHTERGARHDVLSPESWRRSTAGNVFELLSQLRPAWLRPRGASASVDVVVYLDGHKMGGVSVLRRVPVSGVTAIRRLDGTDATSDSARTTARVPCSSPRSDRKRTRGA